MMEVALPSEVNSCEEMFARFGLDPEYGFLSSVARENVRLPVEYSPWEELGLNVAMYRSMGLLRAMVDNVRWIFS